MTANNKVFTSALTMAIDFPDLAIIGKGGARLQNTACTRWGLEGSKQSNLHRIAALTYQCRHSPALNGICNLNAVTLNMNMPVSASSFTVSA